MREEGLERKVCELVKIYGGRAYKFISPGSPGVPDRLCVFPGGKIIFVELKRPGRENGLSAQQKKCISWLKSRDCTVWVINDYADFQRRLIQSYEVQPF